MIDPCTVFCFQYPGGIKRVPRHTSYDLFQMVIWLLLLQSNFFIYHGYFLHFLRYKDVKECRKCCNDMREFRSNLILPLLLFYPSDPPHHLRILKQMSMSNHDHDQTIPQSTWTSLLQCYTLRLSTRFFCCFLNRHLSFPSCAWIHLLFLFVKIQ